MEADGSVRIRPLTLDLRSLKGSLTAAVTAPVTVDAMNTAIRAKAARKSR